MNIRMNGASVSVCPSLFIYLSTCVLTKGTSSTQRRFSGCSNGKSVSKQRPSLDLMITKENSRLERKFMFINVLISRLPEFQLLCRSVCSSTDISESVGLGEF